MTCSAQPEQLHLCTVGDRTTHWDRFHLETCIRHRAAPDLGGGVQERAGKNSGSNPGLSTRFRRCAFYNLPEPATTASLDRSLHSRWCSTAWGCARHRGPSLLASPICQSDL